jgi:hypothetical protein
MSLSTLLLYTKTTGHVLAAATVAASAGAEMKPEDLAGETFPVRYMGNPASSAFSIVRSAIAASELAVVTVDSQAAPISQIHTIIVNPEDKKPGSLDSSRTIASVTFSNTSRTALAVTISAVLTAKASGMVRIERMSPSVPADPADIQLVKFEIAPGIPTTNVQMQTIPAGSFSLMALVQGLRPYLSTI